MGIIERGVIKIEKQKQLGREKIRGERRRESER